MKFEEELVFLCKEAISILYESKAKDIISEEELNLHLTEKEKFVKEFNGEILIENTKELKGI